MPRQDGRFSRSPARRLAPLAAASALVLAALPAFAQASVQVYGLVDVSAGSFQNAGGLKVKRLDSGNLSTSYLGFKGVEDLGGGLKAGFQLDSFLLADSGGASRVPGVDGFWSRNANVYLSGGFGTLKLGRQGPALFVSTLVFNPFGDSFGFSPSIRQYYNLPSGTPLVGDSGWNNAIGYTTPNIGGLTAMVQVAAGEGASTAKGKNIGGNIMYFGGPLSLTAAYQNVKAQGTLGRAISAFPGFVDQKAYQFGGAWDFGFLKAFGQYGVIKTDATSDVKVKNAQAGISVPIGAGKLLAAYGKSKLDLVAPLADKTSQILTLGYDYNLSKRTDLYAIYMSDKYTALSSGTTLAVGVRHTF
jgi:predicted porin